MCVCDIFLQMQYLYKFELDSCMGFGCNILMIMRVQFLVEIKGRCRSTDVE